MKKITFLLSALIFVALTSCSASKTSNDTEGDLRAELDQKNRGNISLLSQIRQKPGIIIKNGVPALQRAENSISNLASQEPLYILDGQIMGNSFNSVNNVVANFMVKKIEILSGSDASSYGVQAAKGVIKITTNSN